VAPAAAQEGVAIKEEWAKGHRHRNGNFVNRERVEFQCGGCFAKFVSEIQDPQGKLDDWKVRASSQSFRQSWCSGALLDKSNIVAERSTTQMLLHLATTRMERIYIREDVGIM
jgi:hypothetical protein